VNLFRWLAGNEDLLAQIALLESKNQDLKEKLDRSKEDERRARNGNWEHTCNLNTRVTTAENRIKEMEAEKEVLLRAITGIGPELLKRLGASASEGTK
jgi:hypothetical protein